MEVDINSLTPYQRLWDHVCWQYPLFTYNAPENSIDLGEITAEGDEHDYSPGPMQYWFRHLSSGIRVVLQRPSDCHDHYPFINVHADKPEIDQIIAELDLDLEVMWRADQNGKEWNNVLAHFAKQYKYGLYRLDDNYNEFLMESKLNKYGAHCLAIEYQRKGHKQDYYVREVT